MFVRIRRAILALLILTFPLSLFAQIVQITLKDGSTVTGELVSFRDNSYLLMINGSEQAIEETRVLDVKLIASTDGGGTTPPVTPTAEDSTAFLAGAVQRLQEMHRRGELDHAVQLLGTLFRDYHEKIAKIREEQKQLILDIHSDYLKRLIHNQHVMLISNELILIFATLPQSDAQALFKAAWEELERQVKQDTLTPFASQWLLATARLCMEQPHAHSYRSGAAKLLVDTALKHFKGSDPRQAIQMMDDAVALYPDLLRDVREPLFQAKVAMADAARKRSDWSAAKTWLESALKLNPKHQDTLDAIQNILFEKLKAGLAANVDLRTQRDFLEQAMSALTSSTYKEWAEKKLAEIKTNLVQNEGAAAKDFSRYFPIQEGLWHRYQSQDGDTTEKIQIDTIVPSGDTVKLYMSQEKTYKSYTTSQSFQIEVDQTHVYKNNRSDILLKLPITVGDSWEWKDGSSSFRRTYKTATASVTTKAGTFDNCLLVEFTSRATFPDQPPITITSYSYYAPRIGLVKLELQESEYQKKYSVELVEYGIPKE